MTKKEYYIKNKQRILNYQKEYRLKLKNENPEKMLNYQRKYYSINSGLVRKRVSERTRKNRIKILNHYGNGVPRCNCCGEKEVVFLCIDHVNNDGSQHRKIVKNSAGLYRWIFKNNYPDSIQILCHNCNQGKEINGICPHEQII